MTREDRKLVAAVEISQKLENHRQRKQDQASKGKEAAGRRLAADEAACVSNSSTRKRRRGEEADAARAGAAKKRKPHRVCPHQRQRSDCKECGGASICQHQRKRNTCKECGGASICQHQRRRSECKECGGASICQHQRQRSTCKECGGTGAPASASTSAKGADARSAGFPGNFPGMAGHPCLILRATSLSLQGDPANIGKG